MQVQQYIYLQDCRRHSVAMSQRGNGHMQVYIIITEGKLSFFIRTALILDRLTRPTTSYKIFETNSCFHEK